MPSSPPRILAILMVAAAMLSSIAAASSLSACGADGGGPAPAASSTGPTASSGGSGPSPTSAAGPNLVLTSEEVGEIRARITAGEEPWASAWTVFLQSHADAELGRAPDVDPGPFTGGVDVHSAFLKLDEDSRAARNLAIAYILSDDIRYAQTAHDILVAWSRESHPTTLEDYDSPDTGQLQSWGAFSFAYAYDLSKASGLYTSDESAAVTDYFRRLTSALRGAAERLAADPSIGTTERLPYEWSDELTYRYEDRVIGGTFAMALDLALLALASQTGDKDTAAWVLEADENPLRADRAVDRALRPDNDGDGQGTDPAPIVTIMRMYRSDRGGTVDYMTYSARLATLLCQVADNLGAPLTRKFRPALQASWLYLARFFDPDAAGSPNPDDVIDVDVCLPRFTLGYRVLDEDRLRDVLDAGPRAEYYEPQYLGPVTLTHWPLR